MTRVYTTLNDAAGLTPAPQNVGEETYRGAVAHRPDYAPGDVKIWYFRPEIATQMLLGSIRVGAAEVIVSAETIAVTHILLGSVAMATALAGDHIDFEVVYNRMQGESWSPNGEARDLILAKGLSHTSMSTGDVIEYDGHFYIVCNFGFDPLL